MLDPATNVMSSSRDAESLKRIIFSEAIDPSCAEILYVVLLSGVVTLPPRETLTPLILIPEFVRAVFGKLVIVLRLPVIVQFSNVLFVTV